MMSRIKILYTIQEKVQLLSEMLNRIVRKNTVLSESGQKFTHLQSIWELYTDYILYILHFHWFIHFVSKNKQKKATLLSQDLLLRNSQMEQRKETQPSIYSQNLCTWFSSWFHHNLIHNPPFHLPFILFEAFKAAIFVCNF